MCCGCTGYGAVLLSLAAPPTIGLDVRVAGGEVTRVPFFRDELVRTLQKSMVDEYLWPRRKVVPVDRPGTVGVPLLPPQELQALAYDDPLLSAERTLAAQPAVGALQEERRAAKEEESDFTINLGVLPDFGDFGGLNLSLALERLATGTLGPSSFGDFTDNIAEFGDAVSNLDFGDAVSNLDFGNQTELVERLANLTELVTGEQTVFGNQTALVERLADLSEQLQASRRRFEPGQGEVPEKWWRFLPWVGEDENRTEAMSVNETNAPWWRFGGGAQDSNRTVAESTAKSAAEPRPAANETGRWWWPFGGGAPDSNRTLALAQPSTNKSVADPRAVTNETVGRSLQLLGWRLGWGWQEDGDGQIGELEGELDPQDTKPKAAAKVGAIGEES